MAIILASASPRRQKLLKQICCQYAVIANNIIEDKSVELEPAELAMQHALAKAKAVAAVADAEDVIIGADTIVVFNKKIYRKPINIKDAIHMLTTLSGKEHQVITGIAVVQGDRFWTDFAATYVQFRELTAVEISSYVATKEPLDKAGAYAIQGVGGFIGGRNFRLLCQCCWVTTGYLGKAVEKCRQAAIMNDDTILTMKELPIEDRPREKLLSKGAQALSNAELLVILLRTGTKKMPVNWLAEKLLKEYKLAGFGSLTPKELNKIRGFGLAKAVTVAAGIKLGIRISNKKNGISSNYQNGS